MTPTNQPWKITDNFPLWNWGAHATRRTGSGGQPTLLVEPSSLAFPVVTESRNTKLAPMWLLLFCSAHTFQVCTVSRLSASEQHSPGSCPHGAYSGRRGESAVLQGHPWGPQGTCSVLWVKGPDEPGLKEEEELGGRPVLPWKGRPLLQKLKGQCWRQLFALAVPTVR